MKKFKLLAIFLVAAVIGLADVFREEIEDDRAKAELLQGGLYAVYVKNGESLNSVSFIRYRSTNKNDFTYLAKDINYIKSVIGKNAMYIRDFLLYQRIKLQGEHDVLNAHDDTVKSEKENNIKIYMIIF